MLLAVVVTSFRHSVSWAQCRKQHMKNLKKAQREEMKKRLWANLKPKAIPGIPGFGIPSDWSVLTDFVNTQALLTQMRYAIWRQSKTFQWVIQTCDKHHAKRFSQSGVPSWRTEGLPKIMVSGRCLNLQSFPPILERV